jgi:hypothetical protein
MVSVLLLVLASSPSPAEAREGNVVLLTLDGVRWQDFFREGADAVFPTFWAKYSGAATIFGDPKTGERFEATNPPLLSLPAYQEMMTGHEVPCGSNQCGRVDAETLIDGLVTAGLGEQLGVVASWSKIAYATSSQEYPFVDAGFHPGDATTPWYFARFDKSTWARAMSAVEKRPRFLWISLNDADEWAHRGSKDNYQNTLRRYDRWFDELVTRVRALEGYGEHTTIIVTTDHGRGEGDDWTSHDSSHPASQRAFAFALGPGTGQPRERRDAGHRALRPTIEALLGLRSAAPLPGVVPGPALVEVVSTTGSAARP